MSEHVRLIWKKIEHLKRMRGYVFTSETDNQHRKPRLTQAGQAQLPG